MSPVASSLDSRSASSAPGPAGGFVATPQVRRRQRLHDRRKHQRQRFVRRQRRVHENPPS
ncbi:hypothetical protein BKA18_004974 [Streptomyces auratus]